MSTADKITDFLKAEYSPYPTDCYAVPGEDSIIDCIHPVTGLTVYCKETAAQIQVRYPDATRMTIDEFCTQKAARQHTPITWQEVTEEKYYDMFEVLPPIMIAGKGFLVSEPWDHDAQTGAPRYAAYRFKHGKHETASRPMTVTELRQS